MMLKVMLTLVFQILLVNETLSSRKGVLIGETCFVKSLASDSFNIELLHLIGYLFKTKNYDQIARIHAFVIS